jgi:hypothetical protein
MAKSHLGCQTTATSSQSFCGTHHPMLSAVHNASEKRGCALLAQAQPAEAENQVLLLGLSAVTPVAEMTAPLSRLFILFII